MSSEHQGTDLLLRTPIKTAERAKSAEKLKVSLRALRSLR